VLRALGLDGPEAASDSPPRFARLRLLRAGSLDQPAQSRRDSVEAQRIERVLAQLGDPSFALRGESYRLEYAATKRNARDRDGFETLSEEELLSVLRALSSDQTVTAPPKAGLSELLALAEAERAKTGHTSLLLLRRPRWSARPAGDRAPTLTPSQLSRAREQHWIEVLVVDQMAVPVSGVALEFELADGTVQRQCSRDDGFARLERIPAGAVIIRLPGLDGNVWRPLGGAGPTQAARPSRAESHVVRRGECLAAIAQKHGFKGWRPLWAHAANEALRARRRNPHVLAPGDVVTIPPRVTQQIVRESDALHRIEVAQGAKRVRFRLQDLAGNALSHLTYDYSYRVGEGSARRAGSKATDADGWLEERVPIGVAELSIETRTPRLRFVFDLGHLLPARDLDRDRVFEPGVARRLEGLGYAPGAGRALLFRSVELGQKNAKGELDAEALDALERAYTA
jgi:hypothetical protein